MCVSNNNYLVFNLCSNLSICFHKFPNPFVLFITFESDNGVDYNGVIFQIALNGSNALGIIVCKLNSTIMIIQMYDVTCMMSPVLKSKIFKIPKK